ncbi:MAG: XTP/dITP diphosphatase [Lachnospiraceae bacterium]
MKIVFATSNEGKLREVKMILSDLQADILSLKDAGIHVEIEENGTTFEENAILKVQAIRPYTDAIILADDSGLEVDYLGKAPGVYSARYMGHETSYDIKNQFIIDQLEGVEGADRAARFVCAIAASFPDGEILTTRGTIEGIIAHKAAGSNGFGYDPIVYVPEYGMTTAEMPLELKNSISHRGKALEKMKKCLIAKLDKNE